MWVAELACDQGHRFEGWFGSRDDFDHQRQRGLVSCPQCGSQTVERCLSAPRLNLGAAASPVSAQTEPTDVGQPLDPVAMLRALMNHVKAHTEDVGPRLAEEARRIHAHEAPERAIRGQATPGEVADLRDEGIEVWALPMLDGDGALH